MRLFNPTRSFNPLLAAICSSPVTVFRLPRTDRLVSSGFAASNRPPSVVKWLRAEKSASSWLPTSRSVPRTVPNVSMPAKLRTPSISRVRSPTVERFRRAESSTTFGHSLRVSWFASVRLVSASMSSSSSALLMARAPILVSPSRPSRERRARFSDSVSVPVRFVRERSAVRSTSAGLLAIVA